MYKMLVLDLDGTLLDDYKEIPNKNIEEINKLNKDFGIIPVIATARPLEVARYIANKGGDAFQSYIIATNGAILMDIQKEEYLINKSLLPEQVKELVEVCKRNALEYEFMTTQHEVADIKYAYRRVIDPMYDNIGVPFNYQSDLEDYISNTQDSIPLFAINGTKKELENCLYEFKNINGIQISGECTRTTPEIDGRIDTICYYDIMRQGVTKASAIEVLANHLNIKKEEIIAVGDGGNDIEMLQVAGLKIAMKNATKKLKEIADFVTQVDNNEGGVGRMMNVIYKALEHEKENSKEKGFEIGE